MKFPLAAGRTKRQDR